MVASLLPAANVKIRFFVPETELGRIKPGQTVTLEIEGKDRQKRSVPVKLRIDTPIEIDYYRHGGILPFVLRQLLAGK